MRSRTHFFIFFVALLLIPNLAQAQDWRSHRVAEKSSNHVGTNPGRPDGRQGGETIETAVPIASLPFYDTGNTTDNVDDYDRQCPYGASLSPDVVYSYAPTNDLRVNVDLCFSGYDTKTYIFDEYLNVVACNDDFYFDSGCGNYVSKIEDAPLEGGQVYFIVIDGYSGDSGDYNLVVEEGVIGHSCTMDCYGMFEGEPPLEDGTNDIYNSGCNDVSGLFPMQNLLGDEFESLTFCGTGGWYLSADGIQSRDTDWFLAEIGSTGVLEWTLDAEQEVLGFLLGPQDCQQVAVLESMELMCEPKTMVIQGNPGDLVWLWVGSSQFMPPVGFVGQEFPYICQFTGLGMMGFTATNAVSFEGIKAMYR